MKCIHFAARAGIVSFSLGCLSLGGCTQSFPLLSHAHLGHSLTAWRDTPDQQGLFVVAEKEAKIAREQATLAVQQAKNPIAARNHAANALHALEPEGGMQGTGLGYGAIRALRSSTDHVAYAADMEDASGNIVRSAQKFSSRADTTIACLQFASEVAKLTTNAADVEVPGLAEELRNVTQECVEGADKDGDGVIGNAPEEDGLVQLRARLSAMLKKERNPPYHPIGHKYLLGLVRLPSGKWKYDFTGGRSGGQLADSGPRSHYPDGW